jgi:hypothetical protein
VDEYDGRHRTTRTCLTCCSEGSKSSRAGNGHTATRTTWRPSAGRPGHSRNTSQAFEYGMPHGGFALGLERWVGRLVGARNIREATLFPRDLNRLTP